MNKQIVAVIIGIFFIGLASAMYAGDCLEVDLGELENLDNVVYDVVGNSSNLEGLTIDLNGTIANICTVPNYKPDSFTIIFIDNSTKTIIKEVYVGGGGGGSRRIEYKEVFIEVDNYIDREVIVEVEKSSPEVVKERTGFSLWFILLPIIIGLIGWFVIWLVSRLVDKENAE